MTWLAQSSPAPRLTQEWENTVGFGEQYHLEVPPESPVSKKLAQILSSESEGKTWLLVCVLPLPSVNRGSSDIALAGMYSRLMGKCLEPHFFAGSHPNVLSVLTKTCKNLPTWKSCPSSKWSDFHLWELKLKLKLKPTHLCAYLAS